MDDFANFDSNRSNGHNGYAYSNQSEHADGFDASGQRLSSYRKQKPSDLERGALIRDLLILEYFDNPVPPTSYDMQSRRSSGDSERASSMYRGQYDMRPLAPINPSVMSVNSYASQTLPHHPMQSRTSSESMRVLPTQPKMSSYPSDRANSFSGNAVRPNLSSQGRPSSGTSTTGVVKKTPVVYPALLSRVAEAFKARVTLNERLKDGLMYPDAFDGRDAVDKIAHIIKTSDRNLALLLGRALDAQKFFHDVTYDHRLRDSSIELYQFRERLASPFLSNDDLALSQHLQYNPNDPFHLPPPRRNSITDTIASSEDSTPSGVFTLLTDCYSPTCTRDRLCYSIACPRRLEQQARLNLKPKPGLQRSVSSESIGDIREPGSLWIYSVPPDVAEKTSDQEKRRQEALNEVFYTERDFVRDMEYLQNVGQRRRP